MFRWKSLAAVAAVSALALTGCAAAGESADESTTLTLGLVTPLTTYEAANMAFDNESPYGQAVFDSLLKTDPTDEILPSLATEWEYNEDRTVLTLSLRDDVTFTDGAAFTADVAKQNLERFKAGTSPNANALAAVTDVAAIDDTTLEITLAAPDPSFLVNLSRNAGYQESPDAFDNPDIETTPVGSGPYILDAESTVPGSTYVYDRNPDYWDEESVHYDHLVLNAYGEPSALLNALKGGQVNGANMFNNDALSEVEASGYTVHASSVNFVGLLLFDRDGVINPALADVRVRQALNYAFDRQGYLDALGGGLGTLTTQVFAPGTAAYDDALDDRYPYDPEKAKELLAEAGYAQGLHLDMPSSTFVPPQTFALIEQSLNEIGVTVTFTDPGQNLIPDLLSGKFAVADFALASSDPWVVINTMIAPGAPWNALHVSDPTVDALISTVQLGTPEESDAALKELNTYIVEQAWFAPRYRPQASFVTDAGTTVETQISNAYPYLWNFTPTS